MLRSLTLDILNDRFQKLKKKHRETLISWCKVRLQSSAVKRIYSKIIQTVQNCVDISPYHTFNNGQPVVFPCLAERDRSKHADLS